MKITQTAIVFAKAKLAHSGLMNINESFASFLQLDTILREIYKPAAAQIQAFGAWTPKAGGIANPIVSSCTFDNGFSVLGDPSKAQIAYDGDLQFNSANPIPALADAMADLLAKHSTMSINSIGLNVVGVCELTNGRRVLQSLVKDTALFTQSNFVYPAFILTYDIGATADKTTLKLSLDENGNDVTFKANFNHFLSSPNTKTEWKTFIGRTHNCISELAKLLQALK